MVSSNKRTRRHSVNEGKPVTKKGKKGRPNKVPTVKSENGKLQKNSPSGKTLGRGSRSRSQINSIKKSSATTYKKSKNPINKKALKRVMKSANCSKKSINKSRHKANKTNK